MSYDHVNDAASREDTSPRGKSATIRFKAKPPQRKTARSPDGPATPQPSAHGVIPSGRVERPPPVAQVHAHGSAQFRSRGGFLQSGDLEGLSITSPPQMPSPEDQEWEHSQPLSRSHRVDDLEESRLSGHASSSYQHQSRDRAHMQSIRVRRATVLCGHSDHGSQLITLTIAFGAVLSPRTPIIESTTEQIEGPQITEEEVDDNNPPMFQHIYDRELLPLERPR
jgi:hypothetical protein